ASAIVSSAPDEAIKIGEHLLSNATSDTERFAPNMILSKSYLSKGNFNKALIYVFDASKYANTTSEKIESSLIKFSILKDLHLDSQADKYLKEIESLSALEPNDTTEVIILLNKIWALIERQDYQEASQRVKNVDGSTLQILLNDPELNQEFNILQGVLFINTQEYDLAETYLIKAKTYSEERVNANYREHAFVLNELSKSYFFRKEHIRAIEFLLQAQELARKVDNISLIAAINHQLAVNYLATQDKENYKKLNDEFLSYNNKQEQLEQDSVNTAFNLISLDQDRYYEQKEHDEASFFYMVLVITLLIVFVLTVLTLKSIWRRKRLKEIVSYLEASRNVTAVHQKKAQEKEEVNRPYIPEETEKILMDKLKKFEQSKKFLNREMSLAVLAGQFETNTKYLSGVINSHYQDNFNTYINKLRINYIIEKLKTDSNYRHYKISYLAEACGFSSHSSFATVFKSITGITPATFIDLLNSEIEDHIDLEEIINEN
ncbi:MAG: helix-turn-helix domain-containing protein, partial [Aequorivita sp.]|nr:helix-turn-helix domain-containing protein [Aequorivita sp.]